MAKRRESTAEASGASEEATEAGAGAKVEMGGAERADNGVRAPLMDLEFVRGLIEAVDGSGIDSLEITRAGTRVKISKTPPAAGPAPTYFAAPPQPAQNPSPGAAAPAPAQAPQAPAETGGGEPATAESESSEASDGLTDVTSPMVGTFYRAPAPDAPPYVEVGSKVSKGQTLCILEAMKLMNELEAEVDGEVREILVENAEPVEYGQVLFRIDTG